MISYTQVRNNGGISNSKNLQPNALFTSKISQTYATVVSFYKRVKKAVAPASHFYSAITYAPLPTLINRQNKP